MKKVTTKKNNVFIALSVDAVMTILMLAGCIAIILKIFNVIQYGWFKVLIPFWILIVMIALSILYINIKTKR